MSSVSNIASGGLQTRGQFKCTSEDYPLVTIITAVYNGAAHLRECLDSVQMQDYPNIEHIVLDAGSKDDTLSILKEYSDVLDLWISEPDSGVYDAWNKGLKLARGEWIAFIGSDDAYLTAAVSSYMAHARVNKDAEYISSMMTWVHPSGYTRTQGSAWAWPLYQRFMCAAHVGSMHRKSLFTQYGTYDTSYRITADYELLLRPRANLKSAFLPNTTLKMRGGGMSESVAALREATRAKVITGGRSPWIAKVEFHIAVVKLYLRSRFGRLIFRRIDF